MEFGASFLQIYRNSEIFFVRHSSFYIVNFFFQIKIFCMTAGNFKYNLFAQTIFMIEFLYKAVLLDKEEQQHIGLLIVLCSFVQCVLSIVFYFDSYECSIDNKFLLLKIAWEINIMIKTFCTLFH